MIKPVNSVFLSMEKPLQDEILLGNGLKLFLAAEYNRSWNATVTAKIAALPIDPTGENKEISEKLNVGDEIAFSYQVVDDVTFGKSGDYFMPTIEENPYVQRFVNSKDEVLSVTKLPPVFGKFTPIWVGLLLDRYGERIDGTQGNEREVKRWLSQFTFSGIQDYKFKNLLEVDGVDYWKCDYKYIFAKKQGDEIIALGDRIILEPIEESVKERFEIAEGIKLPYQTVKIRYMDRGKVVSGGERIGVKKGDIVSFNEQYKEPYDLWGKKYYLIKEKRVNGLWLEET